MENKNSKALKSGVWYTFANFFMKSIGFITTPIFTRLLSRDDYGLFSNFASWLGTFTVFTTLNLGASFISARFDYEDDFDGYVSSTLVLSSISTLVVAVLLNVFNGAFVSLTELQIQYLNIMMVYLLFYSAVDMFQTRERYYFEYKTSVATSLFIALSTAVLSVVLVLNLGNKLFGRIVGSTFPTIVVGIILYIIIIKRGNKVKISYWKYALPICLPYIPHVLSLSLLNAMDKMMITKICGPDQNALYSVAYNCGAIITLLITSLNNAFAPWLGEKLNERDYGEIRRVSKYYIGLFIYVSGGVMLLAPELLLVLGGRSYSEAVHVMPPVAFGCVLQFFYVLHVNVEQFKKRTIGMAIASTLAACSNFILNMLLIPKIGYLAAAYTTLVSYALLLFMHMYLVRRIGLSMIYPTKVIVICLLLMSGYTIAVHFLYLHSLTRYIVLVLYVASTVVFIVRYRELVLRLVRRRQKGFSN